MLSAVMEFKNGPPPPVQPPPVAGPDATQAGREAATATPPAPPAPAAADPYSDGAAVREFMDFSAIPAAEASRREVVRACGLEGKDMKDLLGNAEIEAIVREARQEHGVDCSYIGTVDGCVVPDCNLGHQFVLVDCSWYL